MTADFARLEEIFTAAVAKADPAEREAYLNKVCAGDAVLRQRLEDLLAADADSATFLPLPKEETTAIFTPLNERPGSVIGRYKLLEQIGEGGFGVVFMAEQEQPVRRRVALKIIKAGMDTRQVVARFEAERQALAMMDHPNIARVFDGGATETGRPYFVMELVRGVPITEYCDEARLTTNERLALFQSVCSALQHAHQKGIIHRDLKPSNVLVTMHDDKAVPKVIDFGVAKATQGRLTDRTLFTEFRSMIGTPNYMSPEQAHMSGLDVDTRADIYSLGVLLYELLTGTTPIDTKQVERATYDDLRRLICEEEPPRPSARLSTLSAEQRTTLARQRQCEPAQLSVGLRSELDWVVMKCLEKDRGRRYESASALAADLQRYLTNEPVEACPPSAWYRFYKYAQRNKSALAMMTVLALAGLVALGAITSVFWERAERRARVTGQLELILAEVARLEQAEKWSEALLAAQRAEPALAVGEASQEIQQRAQQAVVELKLIQELDEIRVKSGTPWSDGNVRGTLSSQADQQYATAFREAGIDFDALPAPEAAKRILAHSAITRAVVPALDDWVAVRSVAGNKDGTNRLTEVLRIADPDPWRQRVRDALARTDWPAIEKLAKSSDLDRQPAATLGFLSSAVDRQGISEVEASSSGRAAREFEMVSLGIELLRCAQWKYPDDFWINHRLGTSLIWLGGEDTQEGLGFVRAAVAVRPESSHAMSNLGNGYSFLGQYKQAIKCFRKALELKPDYWICWTNLGMALARDGQLQESIEAFDNAIEINPDQATEAYSELSMVLSDQAGTNYHDPYRATLLAEKALTIEPNVSNHWTVLGAARFRQGKWDSARNAIEKSLEVKRDGTGGALRWDEAINWYFLAMIKRRIGQHDEAKDCYERAIQETENGLLGQTDAGLVGRLRAEAAELLGIEELKSQ